MDAIILPLHGSLPPEMQASALVLIGFSPFLEVLMHSICKYLFCLIFVFFTRQVRVFSPPPSNCRRIIVATNIAETSLTVDGVV